MSLTLPPVIIEPAELVSALETLRRAAKRALEAGESFRALDLANEALDLSPPGGASAAPGVGRLTLGLAHTKALALARTGSYAQARGLLGALPADCQADPEIIAAVARTYKDEAMEAPVGSPARRRRLRQAHRAYLRGFRAGRSRDDYLGINAAAMAAWLDERTGPDGAEVLAESVRNLCSARLGAARQPGHQPADDYWPLATLAEVALLQGRIEEALQRYAAARDLVEGGQWWGHLASTRLQARRHCDLLGHDAAPFEEVFRFPCLVAFSGHMVDGPDRPTPRFPNEPETIEAVKEAMARRLRNWRTQSASRAPVGFVVCSAACGADLLFIEAALAQECPAQVHVVLPWEEEAFLRTSVEHGGSFWLEEFQAVKARVSSWTVLTQRTQPKLAQHAPPGLSGLGLDYCNECIIGIALQRGRALAAEVCPLAFSDGQPADGPGGTASFVGFWRERLGQERVSIIRPPRLPGAKAAEVSGHGGPPPEDEEPSEGHAPARAEISVTGGQPAIKTMLFADVVGYSKITEEQTANFAPVFLGAVSGLIAEAHDARPILSHTWGDAIYMVFDEPEHAGRFALRLADLIREGKPWRADPRAAERRRGGGAARKKGGEPGPVRDLLPADLSIRIALHTGPVLLCVDPVIRQMTFTGNHVSHAARIEPVVARGEIYVSEAFAAYAEIARRQPRQAGDEWLGFGCDYLGQKDFAKDYGRYPLFRLRRE